MSKEKIQQETRNKTRNIKTRGNLKGSIHGPYHQITKIKEKRLHLNNQEPVQWDDTLKSSQESPDGKGSMTGLLGHRMETAWPSKRNTHGPWNHIHKQGMEGITEKEKH